MAQFSSLSKELTKKLGKQEKKENGIFFTPKSIVSDMIRVCQKYNKNIKRILEPSCGSCQVINELDNEYENIEIDGIEFNGTIFTEIKTLEYKNDVKLINADYLQFTPKEKYDLIIGNPPYFVIPKKKVDKSYHKYFNGRPNIFILFVVKAMNELNPNGILAFVLPKSFLNCNYYNELRAHIHGNYKIVSIKDHSDAKYIETGQDTIALIIQKRDGKNKKYTLEIAGKTIFNTKKNINALKEYYKDSTSLKNLDFKVNVGNVVWNQVKDRLTNDESQTRLIYSSDIKENELCMVKYKNLDKKNYINKEGNTDLLLVVNRGYGKGKFKFSYCLIDTDKEYVVENHLICIRSLGEMDRHLLLEKYKLIINSLKSDKTKKFIELYFGNNAINTTELREMVPIYM
jgi:type I restriction-modification system DNA methylase subunit